MFWKERDLWKEKLKIKIRNHKLYEKNIDNRCR